ncbi:MAG: hypothetical protein GY810_31260 [Aureispira sp.]|nr:hypothetical protein [Aureispira sp.]
MDNPLLKNSLSDKLLMIRPIQFGLNDETISSNSFQQQLPQLTNWQVNELAQLEFDNFVALLRANNIDVLVYNDTEEHYTPDSIFPNNWLMTTNQGELLTFPMAAPNRRLERRADIITDLEQEHTYKLDQSLIKFEDEGKYLEGTGSLVLDRVNKIAYAALSPRTNLDVLELWADKLGYKLVVFRAYGPKGEEIYHTNVMMCVGTNFAIIGSNTIAEEDRERVLNSLEKTNHTIVELSNEQVYEHFTGNALQVHNKKGQSYVVLSSRAYRSLTSIQKEILTTELGHQFIAPSLNVIETIGGGSARCMLTEIRMPTT